MKRHHKETRKHNSADAKSDFHTTYMRSSNPELTLPSTYELIENTPANLPRSILTHNYKPDSAVDHKLNEKEEHLEADSDSYESWSSDDEDEAASEHSFYMDEKEPKLAKQGKITEYDDLERDSDKDSENEEIRVSKSGVWDEYGIDPELTLEVSKPIAVDPLVVRQHLQKYDQIERRIKIEGQKFKVVSNNQVSFSLYRAISHAVTGSETNLKKVRKAIFLEILTNWSTYYSEICDDCGYNPLELPQTSKPYGLLAKFKTRYDNSKPGLPLYHLKAASKAYKFHYIIIDIGNYQGEGTLTTYVDEELETQGVECIHHFMRTGTLSDTWYYEYIVPLGPPKLPADGKWEVVIQDVIQVDHIRFRNDETYKNSRKTDPEEFPHLTYQPDLCFGLDHKIYYYKPTLTHDLWSLVSELLYHNISHASRISDAAFQMRLDANRFYHFSKLKKRILYKGLGENERLKTQYNKLLKVPHKSRGDTQDLENIAVAWKFSFILIGMDTNGNFFWKEVISAEEGETETLAFFVRLQKNQEDQWYALENIGWDCPKEREIYGNITFTDDTASNRRLYRPYNSGIFGHLSKKSAASQSKKSSVWGLILSRGTFNKHKVAEGVGQILDATRLAAVAHLVSSASMGFFHRLMNYGIRIFGRKTKVNPTEFKELYIRDLP